MESHSVFTDHVRTFDGSGDIPQEVFDKIESALRNRLRRQGLWSLSPGKLGYEGRKWDDQALQDLVFDCYCHVFIGMSEKNPGQKWENWKLEVAAGQGIEKKIYRSLKNFLYDLQQKSSPEDAAVFKNLRNAVKELIEESHLAVVDGNPDSFSTEWICGIQDSEKAKVSFESLIQFVNENDDWQPALAAVQKFGKRSTRLAKQGVEATSAGGQIPFQFGDLKNAVAEKAYLPAENEANDVVSVSSGENDEFSTKIRTWLDSDSYEFKEQGFGELEKRIHERIDALERRKPAKQKLHEIVGFIAEELRGSAYTTKVTQADVGRELRIAKQTLSDYMKTIRIITEELRNEG